MTPISHFSTSTPKMREVHNHWPHYAVQGRIVGGEYCVLDCVWNVMAHAQKPDFVFRRNGRVHLNRQGLQFSRLLAAEVCGSAVVMLDTPCSEVVRRVLTTHSIRQFPLHFPSRASPCAIAFQLDSTRSWLRCETLASSSGPCKKCRKFTANFTVIKTVRTSLSIRATPIESCVYA
jgi:hypothetical protein